MKKFPLRVVSLIVVVLGVGYFGQGALRSSLLSSTDIDATMKVRADVNADGVLSAREIRRSLIDIIHGVLLRRAEYDIDGDGAVNRADLTSAKESLRRLLMTSCGNGALESGEQCDDGNTTNGDACSNLCSVEIASICSLPFKKFGRTTMIGEIPELGRRYYSSTDFYSRLTTIRITNISDDSLIKEIQHNNLPVTKLLYDSVHATLYATYDEYIATYTTGERVTRFLKVNDDLAPQQSLDIYTSTAPPRYLNARLLDNHQHALLSMDKEYVSRTPVTWPNGNVYDYRWVYRNVAMRLVNLDTFTVERTIDIPGVMGAFPVTVEGTKIWYLALQVPELEFDAHLSTLAFGVYDYESGTHTQQILPYQSVGAFIVKGRQVYFHATKIGFTVLPPPPGTYSPIYGSPNLMSVLVSANMDTLAVTGELQIPSSVDRPGPFGGVTANGLIWGVRTTNPTSSDKIFTLRPDSLSGNITRYNVVTAANGRKIVNGGMLTLYEQCPQ